MTPASAWTAFAVFVCLFFAGLFLIGVPDEGLPSMTWRFHFGGGEGLLGVCAGLCFGRLISACAER